MAYINIRQPGDCRCRQGPPRDGHQCNEAARRWPTSIYDSQEIVGADKGPPGDGHQCIKAARGWPMPMYDSQEIVDAHRGSQELYARLVMVIYLYNFV